MEELFSTTGLLLPLKDKRVERVVEEMFNAEGVDVLVTPMPCVGPTSAALLTNQGKLVDGTTKDEDSSNSCTLVH